MTAFPGDRGPGVDAALRAGQLPGRSVRDLSPNRPPTGPSRGHPKSPKREAWFEIRNAAGPAAEVAIYGEIGEYGVTAEQVAAQLGTITAPAMNVRINSYGGDLSDGVTIYNTLRRHRAAVSTHVEYVAASAASIILMAGDRRYATPQSNVMIHNAIGYCSGNHFDMEASRDMLATMSGQIAAIYADRAGGDRAGWQAAMDAETWYTTDQAVTLGLVTDTEDLDAAAATAGQAAARFSAVALRAAVDRAVRPAIDVGLVAAAVRAGVRSGQQARR